MEQTKRKKRKREIEKKERGKKGEGFIGVLRGSKSKHRVQSALLMLKSLN